MCKLCSSDKEVREMAITYNHDVGNRLQELGSKYHMMATGDIHPHSREAKLIQIQARAAIVNLVNDWL